MMNGSSRKVVMLIVVGVDESPVSGTVLRKAIQEARWRSAELHVVHVLQVPYAFTEIPFDPTVVAESTRLAVWEPLEEEISNADIAVERVDLEGYPPDVLVRYASEQEASLLIVGTRGRGEFASLILGSTSHRAIHLAECDVLVVKGA